MIVLKMTKTIANKKYQPLYQGHNIDAADVLSQLKNYKNNDKKKAPLYQDPDIDASDDFFEKDKDKDDCKEKLPITTSRSQY